MASIVEPRQGPNVGTGERMLGGGGACAVLVPSRSECRVLCVSVRRLRCPDAPNIILVFRHQPLFLIVPAI